MIEEIKQAIEETKQVASDFAQSPKATSFVLAGATSANAWLIEYEPILKITTSLLGIVLVFVLIVKHVVDIIKEVKSNKDK